MKVIYGIAALTSLLSLISNGMSGLYFIDMLGHPYAGPGAGAVLAANIVGLVASGIALGVIAPELEKK